MNNYWQKRFDQIEQKANQQSVAYVNTVNEKYLRAEQQINEKIESWYQRFGDNNGLTATEARKLLNTSELRELKWNVEDYIKAGRENALDGRWMKELENASAKAHISRLEALKLETRQQVEVLTGGMTDELDDMLRSVYKDTYYRSCFEIQKGVGVGFDVARVDDKKLSKILSSPWAVDGSDFSDKVWKNKAKLVNQLDQELSRMAMTGESPKAAIRNIQNALNTSKSSATRLIMTEQAYFTTAAQKDAFGELDVEEYEVVGTLDGKTCGDCGDMDGAHYPVKDMQVGVNAPPFHPYCRCTTVPYFDDEFNNVGERAARDADGKTYYVPSDMTYKQWEKSFVEGDKTGLQKATLDDTIESRAKIKDADNKIGDLKKQFSDVTEGYSYDDWFKDFKSIEDGYDIITEADKPNVNILKSIHQKVQDLIQKKNQWKSQLPVLGGQGTPMNIDDALKGANPNYAMGTQYGVNCQRCVQTYELRRRGYDVEALPKPKSNNTIVWGNECFVDSSGNTPSFTFNQSEKAIKDTLANAPDGSRHIIYAAWKNKSAHVFIAEKENGVVKFVDPQPNKDNVEHYFSLAKRNKFGILRVDDKNITTDTSKLSATVRW